MVPSYASVMFRAQALEEDGRSTHALRICAFFSNPGLVPSPSTSPSTCSTGNGSRLVAAADTRSTTPRTTHSSTSAQKGIFENYCDPGILIMNYRYYISDKLTLQVNLGVYVVDGKYELFVLVDRVVGTSNIQDGQLEIMLYMY
jgi:hypothetical protein